MKTYLVAVSRGVGVPAESYEVRMPNNYSYKNEGLLGIQKRLVKQHKLTYQYACSKPDKCGGVDIVDTNTRIDPKYVTILAVTKLDDL